MNGRYSELFPVILRVDRFGFPKFDGVELAGGALEGGIKAIPDEDNKVLGGWLHSLGDEVHVEVEVAVVEVVNDVLFDDDAQFFYVYDESRDGVGHAFDRDVEVVVVAVPISVGALAKDGFVFFLGPVFHPEFVGGVETFDSGDIDHDRLMTFACSSSVIGAGGNVFPGKRKQTERVPRRFRAAKVRAKAVLVFVIFRCRSHLTGIGPTGRTTAFIPLCLGFI